MVRAEEGPYCQSERGQEDGKQAVGEALMHGFLQESDGKSLMKLQ